MASNLPAPPISEFESDPQAMADALAADPAELKKRRTNTLRSHTKTVNKVKDALKARNETCVRDGRERLVKIFDELERRHQAYLGLTVLTPASKLSEEQWLAGASEVHIKTLMEVDTFLNSLVPSNKSPSVKSVVSNRSSLTQRSGSSSTSAKLREALIARREAELLVRQQLEESKRQEEEEIRLAELQRVQREIERDRVQRAAQQLFDRHDLTSQLLSQQLADEQARVSDNMSDRSHNRPRSPTSASSASLVSNQPSPWLLFNQRASDRRETVGPQSNSAICEEPSRAPFGPAVLNCIGTAGCSSDSKLMSQERGAIPKQVSVTRCETTLRAPHGPAVSQACNPPSKQLATSTSLQVPNPTPLDLAKLASVPQSSASHFPVASKDVPNVQMAPGHRSIPAVVNMSTFQNVSQCQPALASRPPHVFTSPQKTATSSSTHQLSPSTPYGQMFPPVASHASTPSHIAETAVSWATLTPEHRSASAAVTVAPQSYSPDSWISNLGLNNTPTQQMGSSLRPPKPILQTFSGEPREWPAFIQAFHVQVHETCRSDWERQQHLKACLPKYIQDMLGEYLLHPGLYSHALVELQRRFGNRQAVVRSCIALIGDMKPFHDRDVTSLMTFSSKLRSIVATLKLCSFTEELSSCATLGQLVAKLPAGLRSKWAKHQWALQQWALQPPQLPGLDHFDKWLDNIAMAEFSLQAGQNPAKVPSGSGSQQAGPKRSNVRDGKLKPAGVYASAVQRCPLCEEGHPLFKCPKFKELSIEKRADVIKEKSLCLRCLEPGHRGSTCERTKSCGTDGCTGKHHYLLHGAPRIYPKSNHRTTKTNGTAQSQTTDASSNSPTFSGSTAASRSGKGTLLPIVPVFLKSHGVQVRALALLDNGSEVTLLTEATARRLKLSGPEEATRIATVNGTESPKLSMRVSFQVASIDQGAVFDVEGALTVKTLNLSQQNVDLERLKTKWPHLSDIPLQETTIENVSVIIGMDHPALLTTYDVRFDPARQRAPRAILTPFGWCVIGPVSPRIDGIYRAFSTSVHSIWEETHFEEMVTRFFRAEDFAAKPDVKPLISPDDMKAYEILERTVRKVNGRYEAGLLWRSDETRLVNNREAATRRFLSLERRFRTDPDLAKKYSEGINEYVRLGHARKMSDNEIISGPPGRTFYLPHHPVFNPNKPGKCRIVFDAAFKSAGSSLNDTLLRGPDLLSSLQGILLRFREHPYAVIADIEKMFHQVNVKEADRHALRFLWRPPGDEKPPATYQMTVHPFGAVSSPAVVSYVLRQAAKDASSCSEEVLHEIERNFYMDNWLRSFRSEEEALSLARKVDAVLDNGGFRLYQWASPNRTILRELPKQRLAASAVNMDLDETPIERTLGMSLDLREDKFVLRVTRKDLLVQTKRQMLSAVSSMFDPMGFLAPVLATARILLQDVWRAGSGWDDPLDEELIQRWQKWSEALPSLENLTIPRCFTPSRPGLIKRELHVFADASNLAYGTCAYMAFRYEDSTEVSFLMARSRVAPIRYLSVPKLELNAAVLGVRLMRTLRHELDLPLENTFLWSDSTTVLQWIKSTSSKLPVFIANRVAEILEVTTAKQWHYVPTKENPADDASRGLSSSDVDLDHRWFCGPAFLRSPESAWPQSPLLPAIEDEPSLDWVGNVKSGELHIDRLVRDRSDLNSIKRSVAYLLRWTSNARSSAGKRKVGPLDVDDLVRALNLLISRAQLLSYSSEVSRLKSGKQIDKSSPLINFTPFMDDQGLIRVGGRLGKAPLPFDVRHPVLLPPKARITELIVWQTHLDGAHSATEATLHKVRHTYWVPRGRQTVKRILFPCIRCALFRARAINPKMADLPTNRLECFLPPFSHTGVDLFGPYQVKIGRSYHKRWVCLFTCGTTRAVHLEVVKSMSSDCFLNAMARFENLRGRPAIYYSDQGTNFVGAKNEITACLSTLDQTVIKSKLAGRNIKWRFNPPSSPHFGGVWEALVRSAKRALHFILENRTLDDETFVTAVAQVTGLLNSRPLTTMSEDLAAPEPLTPNHLLLGRSNPNTPPDLFDEGDLSSRKCWRAAQALTQLFWERWVREYAPTLIERRKWSVNDRNLSEGDAVAVLDRKNVRGQWVIGRVKEPIVGSDGIVRSAVVIIPKPGSPGETTEIHRPAVGLALLEPAEDLAPTQQQREDDTKVTDMPEGPKAA